jgi:hypothetical protein
MIPNKSFFDRLGSVSRCENRGLVASLHGIRVSGTTEMAEGNISFNLLLQTLGPVTGQVIR